MGGWWSDGGRLEVKVERHLWAKTEPVFALEVQKSAVMGGQAGWGVGGTSLTRSLVGSALPSDS